MYVYAWAGVISKHTISLSHSRESQRIIRTSQATTIHELSSPLYLLTRVARIILTYELLSTKAKTKHVAVSLLEF
jgi:hypothetical protein